MRRQNICIHCGAEIEPHNKFCSKCGNPVPESVQQNSSGELKTNFTLHLIVLVLLVVVGIGQLFGHSGSGKRNTIYHPVVRLNKKDKSIVRNMKNVYFFYRGFARFVSKDEKFGVLNTAGAVVAYPEYDRIEAFNDGGFAIAEKDGKVGAIDETGKEIYELNYDDVYAVSSECAIVSKDGECLIVNSKGKQLGIADWDEVEDFSCGRSLICKDGLYGYADESGEIVVEPEYEDAEKFYYYLAAVQKDGVWGYIDRSGKVAIACQYESAREFTEDERAWVRLNDRFCLIDRSGNMIVETSYERVDEFVKGAASVVSDDLVGYINTDGEEIIPTQYHAAYDWYSDRVWVMSSDGGCHLFDYEGHEYGEPWPLIREKGIGADSWLVNVGYRKLSYVDKNNKVFLSGNYEGAIDFCDGVAIVRVKDQWYVIDEKGKDLYDGTDTRKLEGEEISEENSIIGEWTTAYSKTVIDSYSGILGAIGLPEASIVGGLYDSFTSAKYPSVLILNKDGSGEADGYDITWYASKDVLCYRYSNGVCAGHTYTCGINSVSMKKTLTLNGMVFYN